MHHKSQYYARHNHQRNCRGGGVNLLKPDYDLAPQNFNSIVAPMVTTSV